MKTKQIRLNVNIFFSVPEDYKVTDTESIKFKGAVELHGENDKILATRASYHEITESVDMKDLGDRFILGFY